MRRGVQGRGGAGLQGGTGCCSRGPGQARGAGWGWDLRGLRFWLVIPGVRRGLRLFGKQAARSEPPGSKAPHPMQGLELSVPLQLQAAWGSWALPPTGGTLGLPNPPLPGRSQERWSGRCRLAGSWRQPSLGVCAIHRSSVSVPGRNPSWCFLVTFLRLFQLHVFSV